MLLFIFILGEILSISSILYIKCFGNSEELFKKYDYNEHFPLFSMAVFGGWATFPFFLYAAYKQFKINEKEK